MMFPQGRYSTGYGSRRSYNPNRPQLSVRRRSGPVDETFYPKSDLSKVDGDLELRINIPGFVKEEVKISKFESLGYISVEGEKKRIDNSRLLFNTIQAIPEDYNISQATTELDRGILTIKIPKKETADAKTGTAESKASTSGKIPGPEESTTAAPDTPKIKEGNLPTLKAPVGLDEETHEKVAGVKISPGKVESEAKSPKDQDGASLKAGVLARSSGDGGSADQKPVEKKETSQANWKAGGTEKLQKLAQRNLLKDGNGEKSKASSIREGAKLDSEGTEKESTDQRGVVPGREEKKRGREFADTKEKHGEDIITRRENSSMAAKEQKELLINICVGVSVIVALGGHIVYNFSRN